MSSRTVAGVLLLIAAVAYSAWLMVLFLPTGLSLINGYVSELGANGQRFQGLFRATDVVAGIALMLAALLLPRFMTTGWLTRLIACSLFVFGLTVLIGAVFSLDCASSMSELCRQRVDRGEVSFSHRVHVVSSVMSDVSVFTALIGAQWLIGAAFRRMVWIVALLIAATGLCIVLLDLRGTGLGVGLILEIQLAVIGATLLAVSILLLRPASSTPNPA